MFFLAFKPVGAYLRVIFNLMVATTVYFYPNISQANELKKYLPVYSPSPEKLNLNNYSSPPQDTTSDNVLAEELIVKIKKRHNEEFGPMATAHMSAEYQDFVNSEFGSINRSFQGSYIYLNEKTQDFGEYATGEIIDYHLDKQLKKNTSTRNIYKTKRQFTQQNLNLSSNVRAECRVSIPNQEVEVRVINPYINIITRQELKNKKEFYTIINKKLSYNFKVEAIHKSIDGTLSLVTHKILTPKLETNLTYSTYTKELGLTPRENSLIIGMNYIF